MTRLTATLAAVALTLAHLPLEAAAQRRGFSGKSSGKSSSSRSGGSSRSFGLRSGGSSNGSRSQSSGSNSSKSRSSFGQSQSKSSSSFGSRFSGSQSSRSKIGSGSSSIRQSFDRSRFDSSKLSGSKTGNSKTSGSKIGSSNFGSSLRDRIGSRLTSRGTTTPNQKTNTNVGRQILNRVTENRFGGNTKAPVKGFPKVDPKRHMTGNHNSHHGLTKKQKALGVLVGLGRLHAKKHHSWGVHHIQKVHHHGHGWGVHVKHHDHGFGFCYRPVVRYTNPYSKVRYIDGCDYSVACVPVEEVVVTTAGEEALAAAVEAFRNGDLATADRAITIALREMPTNPDVRLLHSLILFAAGDYENAAAACNAALTASAGWDWDALSNFYANPEAYRLHLRSLEQAVIAQPRNGALRFLVAYHYMVLGHESNAAVQFQQALVLQPGDAVSKQLLELAMSKVEPTTAAPAVPSPAQPQAVEVPAEEPVVPLTGSLGALAGSLGSTSAPVETTPAPATPANSLVGDWKANPTSGLEILFSVQPDGRFTWKLNRNGEESSFSGTAKLEAGTMTLTRENDGETLQGSVKFTGSTAFEFQLEGSPAITFTK